MIFIFNSLNMQNTFSYISVESPAIFKYINRHRTNADNQYRGLMRVMVRASSVLEEINKIDAAHQNEDAHIIAIRDVIENNKKFMYGLSRALDAIKVVDDENIGSSIALARINIDVEECIDKAICIIRAKIAKLETELYNSQKLLEGYDMQLLGLRSKANLLHDIIIDVQTHFNYHDSRATSAECAVAAYLSTQKLTIW